MSYCPPSSCGVCNKCQTTLEFNGSSAVSIIDSKKKLDFSNLSQKKVYVCENSKFLIFNFSITFTRAVFKFANIQQRPELFWLVMLPLFVTSLNTKLCFLFAELSKLDALIPFLAIAFSTALLLGSFAYLS